ncbi:MAG TPA: cytochrome C, partial [Thermoanaerobaculia bacterium]|nr:cytochrome C [Thermoanaerobaculia bacterium]
HQESLASYRDSFHGQVTDLGFVTAATCSDCHTPHANLPASNPAASIHPDHLAATCGQCHEGASPAFLSFDPHAEPQNRAKNPGLWAIWLFMTTLLVAVFGFFGIHTLLWLQRSVVALSRGELRHERTTEGPWVRRFRQGQLRTHAVVIVTFLLLAATGLPLKFHYTDWAQTLLAWPGGVSLARFLHRTAALVTFGYFLFHLGTVLKRALIGREPGMFYGWMSLVPRPKDLADLWANLRYFLYLGPRPRFDRWTYWEKFDYFAVFWGVAIIGASGLLLWFPQSATRVVPGWALNAAYVIHSDEALLAVGFIFVFHFFHAHLRPEAFPMDPVIFLGAMPLERFRAERPLEYQRLVERGELEARLVPAPTARRLRTARIWGLSAVAVGLVLVTGILWGFLGH